MVLRRCATTTVVRPVPDSAAMLSCTCLSVMLSSDDVASSSKRMGAFLRIARPIATRCFSPPLSRKPRSPTTVSYFWGKRSCTCESSAAALAAARTSSSLASSLPYRRLCCRVSLKSTQSCGTTPMARRSESCVSVAMSTPSNLTQPEGMS
mmetsp:Transcript_9375/g.29254  ORF Transcript_9375/g.29254 Transcript_9375/m.29254 type:complete len:151 (-) Transcript_9375:127-579(-)